MISHGLPPTLPVICGFLPVRFSGRDDPNHGVVNPIAMAHDQNSQFETDPQHQEAIFVWRMIWIKVANGILIEEDALSLLKRHSVLAFVLPALCLIPFEAYVPHMYIVRILEEKSSDFLGANGFYKSCFILKGRLLLGLDGTSSKNSFLLPRYPIPRISISLFEILYWTRNLGRHAFRE